MFILDTCTCTNYNFTLHIAVDNYTDTYIAVYCNSAQTEPNNLVTLVPFQKILRVFHSIKLYRIILSFSELMSISVYELNLSKTCCMLQ